MMSIPTRRLVTIAALGALLTGCAASAESAPVLAAPAAATTTPTAVASTLKAKAMTTTPPTTQTTALDRVVTAGKSQYMREVSGGKVKSLLHQVARDPALLRALATSDSAARAYVAQQFPNVWYHWHISRMRIVRGSTVVTERGVPFVVNGPQMKLRGSNGSDLGTLQISLQDEIGFVRLMHRNYPVDVVVRGATAADVRSSLPAATQAALPAGGTTTIAGRRYAVRSFNEMAWNNEPVTIWFLAAA
jgi:hypothetical protein